MKIIIVVLLVISLCYLALNLILFSLQQSLNHNASLPEFKSLIGSFLLTIALLIVLNSTNKKKT
jgi:hypothetical protein